MFEKILSDALTKILGKYIDGLNEETLNIAVWGGNVELKNLQIKKEALDLVNIPFNIVGGVVGKLEITVPWRKVWSSPTILKLSDLHVIIGPRKEQKVISMIKK